MSKHVSSDVIRRRISTDLLQLSQVLQKEATGIVINPDVLKSSANAVIKSSNGSSWAYKVSGLQLRADVPQNSLPMNCIGPLTIDFDLELAGNCNPDEAGELTKLILQLVIRSEPKEHVCAWHFDRHIEGKNPSQEAHPMYHFQHGGHAMKPHADSLGQSLLLPAPRLAFPPMDTILAIDFVLSNFAGECWKGLRDEPTYLRLLQESQASFWKPYIQRLASWWDKGPKKEAHKIVALLPHLA